MKNQSQETILYSGGANHVINGESVGGKLYLYEDRLCFNSHKFNVRTHNVVIHLDEIVNIQKINYLFVIPTGLTIVTNSSIEDFMVYFRETWINMINNQIRRQKGLCSKKIPERKRIVTDIRDISQADTKTGTQESRGRRLEI